MLKKNHVACIHIIILLITKSQFLDFVCYVNEENGWEKALFSMATVDGS